MTKSLKSGVEGQYHAVGPDLITPAAQDETVDLFEILRILTRRWLVIWLVFIIVMTIMALKLFSTTPMYRAEARIYIDPRKFEVVDLNAVVSDVAGSSAAFDGEVMLLRSRAMAERVVRSLDLVNNEIFKQSAASAANKLHQSGEIGIVYSRMLSQSGDGNAVIDASPEQIERAVSRLLRMVTVSRFGETSVFSIQARHHDGEMAKILANEYANQYIQDKSDARRDATKSANDWLRNRINELAEQVRVAEAAVETFRAESGLLDLRGSTITQQDVQNTIQSLDDVRTQRDEIAANLRQMRRELSTRRFAHNRGETLDSTEIQDLRRQLRAVEQDLAEASSRYLPEHPKMIRLQKEREEILAGISNEVNRYATQLQSELDAQNRLVQEQEARFSVLQSRLAGNNASNVRLRELEREAETSRFIYEQFLARFKETREQEFLSFTQARIISEAVRPARPFSPKVGLNIMVGVIASVFFGLVLVVFVEIIDRTFWNGAEVERRLRIPFLGFLPRYSAKGMRRLSEPEGARVFLRSFQDSAARTVFSETQLQSPSGAAPYTIAVAATDRNAGHHSVLINMALVAQQEIGKVIIVDGDLSHKGISQRMFDHAPFGLGAVIEHNAPLQEVVLPMGVPGIDLLSMEKESALGGIPMPALNEVFKRLQEDYAVVIVDCGVMDKDPVNRIFAVQADGAVIVGKERASTQERFEALIRLLRAARIRPLGVVMTHQSFVRRKIIHLFTRLKGKIS